MRWNFRCNWLTDFFSVRPTVIEIRKIRTFGAIYYDYLHGYNWYPIWGMTLFNSGKQRPSHILTQTLTPTRVMSVWGLSKAFHSMTQINNVLILGESVFPLKSYKVYKPLFHDCWYLLCGCPNTLNTYKILIDLKFCVKWQLLFKRLANGATWCFY